MRFLLLKLLVCVPSALLFGQQEQAAIAATPQTVGVSEPIYAEQTTPESEVEHKISVPVEEQGPEITTPAMQHNNEEVGEIKHEEPLKPTVTEPAPIPEAPKMESPTAAVSAGELAPESRVEDFDVDTNAGFDTLGLEEPEGNWLIKRIWWEKAEVTYEKIKNLIDQILDSRMNLFNQRNEVESKILDPFYIQQSLTQGQLEEVVSYLLDELKHEREKEKGLNDVERQMYDALLAEQRSLEQLNMDIEAIRKLDIALDDALTKLMEQINLCRNYEKQAWTAFKDIAKVLDHNKARSLYYSMDSYLNNIKSISKYIQGDFNQYFADLIDSIKQNVERIKSTLSRLKEKGIDFKQQLKKIQEEEMELEKQPEPEPVKPKIEEEEEEVPQGWFEWAWSGVSDFFANMWHMIAFWK